MKKQKYINPDVSILFIYIVGKVKCGKMTEIIKLKWKSSDFGEWGWSECEVTIDRRLKRTPHNDAKTHKRE